MPPSEAEINRRPKTIVVLVALLAVCVLSFSGLVIWKISSSPGDAAIGGPFTLEGPERQTITDQTFHGKYMLIYFGYTFCPDICPTTMADLGIALKTLGPQADKIQPLFITVDPARDTPEVLKQYTAQFSPRLLGLTGAPDEIARVEHEYKVYAAPHRTGTGPNDYLMDHSSIFYLMGPDGRFMAILDAAQEGDALARDIAHHMRQ